MSHGPIHRRLQELRGRVPGGPLRRRRVLAELRAHLEDAAAEEQRSGHTREQAERLAVERFGVPFAGPKRGWPTRIAPPVVISLIVLAAVAVAVASRGGGSSRPHALGPAMPYASVPICGSPGRAAQRVHTVFTPCRPRPAVATARIPVAAIGTPTGATQSPAGRPTTS